MYIILYISHCWNADKYWRRRRRRRSSGGPARFKALSLTVCADSESGCQQNYYILYILHTHARSLRYRYTRSSYTNAFSLG